MTAPSRRAQPLALRRTILRACTKRCGGYVVSVTQAVAQILNEAERLSVTEREELADRLMESLLRNVPPAVQQAQLAEVRRRIAQVDSGEVALVPGDEALERVRKLAGASRAER